MSNFSTLFAGTSAPLRTTIYTSGTGTYVPTVNNARCFVTVIGGGGGGDVTAGYAGGAGGGTSQLMLTVPAAGFPYAVGAGGAVGSAGGTSYFGSLYAGGGSPGASNAYTPIGGYGTLLMGGGALISNDSYMRVPASSGSTTSLTTGNLVTGGYSLMGIGGTSTVPAYGYGAGGYSQAAGTSGVVIIYDYGA